MSLQTNTTFNMNLEAHLVAKLEDYAPTAQNLSAAINAALNEFFTLREKPAAEPPKP